MSTKDWVTLIEVNDRLEAEIIKEALEAHAIPAEIFQEGITHFAYPVNVGPMARVEICVPVEHFENAKAWLDEYQSGGLNDMELKDEE
jgi:hypothetical protein